MIDQVIVEPGHRPIKCWTRGVELEEGAKQQLLNVASLPFIYKHVAVMPDCHQGIGATVGSVIATRGAIVPAAVGVDLSCGMIAQRLDLTAADLPDTLEAVRAAIEIAIPHGRTDNGGRNDQGAWRDDSRLLSTTSHRLPLEQRTHLISLGEELRGILDRHPKMAPRDASAWTRQCGTLGTGNHFVEICLDEEQRVWIMLHSGSRGIGNAIGRYFIERAKETMRAHFIPLADPDLAYLPEGSPLFEDYWHALMWAQAYAATSRLHMMEAALAALRASLDRPMVVTDQAVHCNHNYVAREHHFSEDVLITRKGAVRARLGDLGIIPGSMGAKSYIVRGKGNPDSFMSCSHGAGRRMSRGEARRTITLADHIKATEGVECRKDEGVLDESPAAYKDLDAVMAAQTDLVDIVHTLKAVLCIKG